ncbi:hypothetical protein EX30DRAFT_54559 [Ascodesmis nigricans]|uniref:Uncharacterized protein n=1 Tax=Ascodesmis nigricans TaxID=341454 RepID=A0A4S2MVK4_9PEZI|nr:hypothetical protein EX30DRAFT_54559 [Ascodesmis nigricans]
MAMTSLATSQYPTPTMTIVPASSVNRHVQPAYQQPQQQVVQTRVVQVTQTKTDDGNNPVLRKFVNFKNLTERSRTRQSWEHCEHLDINLNPEELEQKVREHDVPGRDLITCFGNLGTFRQKHVRSYEHKLNARESDPGNWYWVLEALGEVRDHTTFTVNTFWAIFRRSPRNGNQQPPTRQIVVHNDPTQILTAGQQPGQTLVVSSPLAITGPVSSQLALPAPPSVTANAYPSSTTGSVYQVPQSTVPPAQYESTTTTQTTTYQPAATATSYGTGLLGATPAGNSYPRQIPGSGYRASEHDVLQYTGPESSSNHHRYLEMLVFTAHKCPILTTLLCLGGPKAAPMQPLPQMLLVLSVTGKILMILTSR